MVSCPGFKISPNLPTSTKSYAVSRLLTKFMLVLISPNEPISPNLRGVWGFYHKLLLVCDWRQSLNFPDQLFLISIWLRLVEYLILHILVFHFIWTYCETPYKTENNFQIVTSSQTPMLFINFRKKKFISVPISPKVPNIAPYKVNFLHLLSTLRDKFYDNFSSMTPPKNFIVFRKISPTCRYWSKNIITIFQERLYDNNIFVTGHPQ